VRTGEESAEAVNAGSSSSPGRFLSITQNVFVSRSRLGRRRSASPRRTCSRFARNSWVFPDATIAATFTVPSSSLISASRSSFCAVSAAMCGTRMATGSTSLPGIGVPNGRISQTGDFLRASTSSGLRSGRSTARCFVIVSPPQSCTVFRARSWITKSLIGVISVFSKPTSITVDVGRP